MNGESEPTLTWPSPEEEARHTRHLKLMRTARDGGVAARPALFTTAADMCTEWAATLRALAKTPEDHRAVFDGLAPTGGDMLRVQELLSFMWSQAGKYLPDE